MGIVIGGLLSQGRVNVKEHRDYHLGPNAKGEFVKVNVVSIHRHRTPVRFVHCGQTATLAIEYPVPVDWKIHRGMVLLGTEDYPECYFEFEAELVVLFHATGVSCGTSGMFHSGSIRQHARVVSLLSDKESSVICSGGQGKCTFRLMHEPRYLRLGAQILFIEGKSKCLGRVTRLIPRVC